MHPTIKPSLIALLLLSSQVQAAGFQLAEQSATGRVRSALTNTTVPSKHFYIRLSRNTIRPSVT